MPAPMPSGRIPPGRRVRVKVPATSANLGPGFDCFGLALDWYDEVTVESTAAGFEAVIDGEGAARLPTDKRHLVIRTVLTGCARLGLEVSGLRLQATNTIPHGRGLGSSSAAIVSGLAVAQVLAGRPLDRAWTAELAAELEGHPDNAAAATFGGFVLAYSANGLRVVQGEVAPEVAGLVCIPQTRLATQKARGLLPSQIPFTDATANLARSAIFVHAIARAPELLFDATEDWLHQFARSSAMPQSYALLERLRDNGFPAVVSGAGSSILVLGTHDQLSQAEALIPTAFRQVRLGIGAGVEVVD